MLVKLLFALPIWVALMAVAIKLALWLFNDKKDDDEK